MELKVKISEICRTFVILILCSSLGTGSYNPKFFVSLESFNQNLFSQLVHSNGKDNVIYSPFSIQTSLAMLRLGADGQTAAELDNGLCVNGQTPARMAENYYSMLFEFEDSNILKMANKIYVNESYKLREDYKKLLSKKFFSSVENLNFTQRANATKTINTWIKSRTKNAVNNFVSPDLLGKDIRLLVLSTMYFNGKWAIPFPQENTSVQDFYIDALNTVKVRMMFRKGAFGFGLVRQLVANVVRLPYKDSRMSMLIILPIRRSGLADLQLQLLNFQYRSLRRGVLLSRSGLVHLPKFKVEFEIELSHSLKKMSMSKMFDKGDFGKMLNSTESIHVSKFIHKAAIEVSEGASDDTAATREIGSSRLSPFSLKADHPFAYAIINEDFIPLFQGTFVGF